MHDLTWTRRRPGLYTALDGDFHAVVRRMPEANSWRTTTTTYGLPLGNTLHATKAEAQAAAQTTAHVLPSETFGGQA